MLAAPIAPQPAAAMAGANVHAPAPAPAPIPPPARVHPAIMVSILPQLIAADRLPARTNAPISEGTPFVMGGVHGSLARQTGAPIAGNIGNTRRIEWPVGTMFYINDNVRAQNAITAGHQRDTLPVGTTVILLPGTQINWNGRLVAITADETEMNRTVILT